MNFDELPKWLFVCEGMRLKPYLDTKKKWTFGIGRNLSDCFISKIEADYFLKKDGCRDKFFNLPALWYKNVDDLVKYFKMRTNNVEEIEFLLNNDIQNCINELSCFSWYEEQPESVKCALINMRFNMGLHGLLGFTDMIKYLAEKNYAKAAIEALNSDWANDVGKRAKDVALIIRQGAQ